MPANIAKGQNAVMMAYQGATPWHQLGTHIEDPDIGHSVPKFLEAANLDWTVSLKSMYFRIGKSSVRVPERKAVVRSSDNQLLATVGGDYVPLQNSDAFAVLQPACEQLGVTIETAGAIGAGDRVWMLARLPESIEPIPGDTLKNYLLVLTSHNGWMAYSARLTQVRVVCENTLQLAKEDEAFVKLRHVKSDADRLEQVSAVVTNMLDVAKRTGKSFADLAQTAFTMEDTTRYIEEVLNLDYDSPVAARRRDNIVELATRTGKGIELAPGTAWAAYNAITEYVDHVRPAEVKAARTLTQANESALFGTNAKLKEKALVVARRMAA